MCEEQEKDFSLLRPFDLEAAKHGEFVCTADDDEPSRAIHIFDSGKIAIDWSSEYDVVSFVDKDTRRLRMAPLCWVEGRPVYRGDVLYWKPESRRVVVAKVDNDKNCPLIAEDGRPYKIKNVSWTPPKVKREGWVNIYPVMDGLCVAYAGSIYTDKKTADKKAANNRVACVRIEWEE